MKNSWKSCSARNQKGIPEPEEEKKEDPESIVPESSEESKSGDSVEEQQTPEESLPQLENTEQPENAEQPAAPPYQQQPGNYGLFSQTPDPKDSQQRTQDQ